MTIKDILGTRFIQFDGAMGTMLQKAGLKGGELPETYNITHPETIMGIHQSYIRAGAEVISTNTFQANELKLNGSPYSVEAVIGAGVQLARDAGAPYVALDIGPLGQMDPIGDLSFDQAYAIFARQVVAGAKAGVDLILFETFSDLLEMKAAVLAAKENSTLPVFSTMTFDRNNRTLMGNDPISCTLVLQSLGVAALGVNCSLGPKELFPIIKEIIKYAQVPVIAQPNAGLPKFADGKIFYDIDALQFAGYICELAQLGVAVLGGCCGTTPDYIAATKKALEGISIVKNQQPHLTCICSERNTVHFGQALAVGEGFKYDNGKYQDAVNRLNVDQLATKASTNSKAGMQFLKLNIEAVTSGDGSAVSNVIKELQSSIQLPLYIEGSGSAGIEAALRLYNGKPLVGLINQNDETLAEILPVIKKYGASFVVRCDTGERITPSVEDYLERVHRVIEMAGQYDIPVEDVIVDCSLPLCEENNRIMEAFNLVAIIKKKPGLMTIMEINKESLPNSEAVNLFISQATAAGLDGLVISDLPQELMISIQNCLQQ